MKTLTLLTELAALTIVVSNTAPYTAHNTCTTYNMYITDHYTERGTVHLVHNHKNKRKCVFTILIAKAAIYFCEYQESYCLRLSMTIIYMYTSLFQSTSMKVSKTSCNTDR